MKKIIRDVIKAGVLFFAVGALLALSAPPLAILLGPSLIGQAAFAGALQTPILWTGAFFGAFGAINAALEPVSDWIFGAKAGVDTAAATQQEAKRVNITIMQSPQQSQGQVVADSNYRQIIEAERLAVNVAEKSLGAR